MRSTTTLAVLTLLFLLGEGCVVVKDKCNPRNCAEGCCTAAGECVNGSAANACGNGGNTCSVCPGSFVCSLGTCQPSSGNGGGAGGGSGGGFGGGSGGGFTGGGGGSSSLPGDVVFTWNFAGQSCAQQTAVRSVRVTIPGQTLANGGVYACNNGGTDGIMLLNFAAGGYSYTLEALSATNVVLFQAAGTFTVNGTATVNATLTAVGGAALVSWTFPPNSLSSAPNCTQAGIANVLVTIDTTAAVTVPCTQGFGASVRFDGLSTGSHAVVLEAVETGGYAYYRKTGTLLAQATPAQNTYLFDWAVGSLPLKWTFSNGTTQVNCAQAGISTMNIVLRDSLGADVYGATGVDVPCLDGAYQGTTFTLNGDTYTAYLQAYGTGSVLYRSNFTTPPSVTVTNGQFPALDATTPAVLLTP